MPPDASAERARMVERQLRRRGIADEHVLGAMAAVPREAFLPAGARDHAYEDRALSLGHGQTISQPFMVAAMCELVRARPGVRALEIGAGSGYAAAVLDELTGDVVAIERLEPLAATARAALDATGHGRVDLRVGDGAAGARDRAPFDAIVVSAAVPAVPEALLDQLADGGRLVAPVGTRDAQSLELVTRRGASLEVEPGVACRFVPLVGEAGFAG